MRGPVFVMFWLFVAVLIVTQTWRRIAARREVNQTIRLAIEKGQPLDPAVIDQLIRSTGDWSRGSRMAGLMAPATLLAIGVGIALMGVFIRIGGQRDALYPLLGVGVMLFLMGLAQTFVWWLTHREASQSAADRPRTS